MKESIWDQSIFIYLSWAGALYFVGRTIYDATVLAWREGLQVWGGAVVHGPLSILCTPALIYLVVFSIRVAIRMIKRINIEGKIFVQFAVTIIILALGLAVPFQYLQILMLEKYGLPKDARSFFSTQVKNGNLKMMKLLLEKGLEFDDSFFTVELYNTCFSGHVDVIEYLLQRGANINAQLGESKNSALMNAAESGHEEAVRTLLIHGAELSLRNSHGETALDLANKYGHKAVVEILRKNN
jgi:ankyrin repeat protein